MKITGAEVFLVALPSRREHTWASKMETPIGHHAILRLDTDEGISGWGEAPGVPVWRLLGGKRRDGIEVAHSLGIMPVRQCVDEAEQAVAEGAGTIKCKTGLDPQRDVELVRALRGRLGDEVKIRVDGNEGYRTVAQAVET